jgi:conjugal transfer pilus assembly protein TraA
MASRIRPRPQTGEPRLRTADGGLAVALFAVPALAGTDTTFDTAFTKFSGFLEGSGGKIITLISLVGGLIGLASGRFSMAQIAIPVGVGIGVGTGIPIVTSTITAII